mgnify:FL=1
MANFTEREGIFHCGKIAAKNHWMFREQPVDDVGIDAHMEFAELSGKSKQLIALQIKSGESWFNEKKDGYVIFRKINERQYNYWIMNPLPCIVVLYNPDDQMCIWQKLTKETIERTDGGNGKGFLVKIPLAQIFLNDLSHKELLTFSKLPEYSSNYNFLLSQKKFMQIIQKGGMIKLHSTEWIHKSSGKGNIELIVKYGKSIERYSYPYWFPATPYTMVFPRLFPWADFAADKDFYEENDMELWHQYHCYYDEEDEEWLAVGDTFEEFREKLNPMRNIEHSGEVAEYMLVLSLNELGKAFLRIDKFVSQNQPYIDVRPNGG